MKVALPFTTFDEIAALGLEVEINCPACRHRAKADPRSDRLRGKRFVDVRFRCRQMVQRWTAHPAACCDTLGHLCILPAPGKVILPRQAILYAHVACGSCVPHWAILQAPRQDPVWKPVWDRMANKRNRLACPGCNDPLITSWQGQDGIPYTDGWRRRA